MANKKDYTLAQWGPDDRPIPSDQLVDVAKGWAGDTMLLSLSGRDSLAAWLFLRERGVKLIPYFCYTVPGLSYDEEWLSHLENFFGVHVIRLPHPLLYEMLNSCAWMPPHFAANVLKMNLPRFDFAFLENILAEQNGLGSQFLSVVGIRAADNLMRLRMIRQMGPIGIKRRHYYYAVWDWKTEDVKQIIAKHGVKLSRSYRMYGSTGDGVDYTFLKTLKENGLEQDYQKVLEYFPLADMEFFRYETVK